MPVITAPELPESIDPKNASVFDPLYKTLMRKATSLAGLDDPQSMAMQSVAPSPLIAKVPFNMMAGRNANLLEWAKNFSPELQAVVEGAAKRYPRILSHVQGLGEADLGKVEGKIGEKTLGFAGSNPRNDYLSDIVMNPKAISKYPHRFPQDVLGDTAETFGHELTHAAQRLWHGPDVFDDMYRAANNWEGKPSYGENVLEDGARKAGANFRGKIAGTGEAIPPSVNSKPQGLMDKLMGMFSSPPGQGIEDTAQAIGRKPGWNHQLMQAGNNVYKNINGHWIVLNDAEKTSALNRIKPFEAPTAIKSAEDLATITPSANPNRPPPPKLSGVPKNQNAAAAAMSRSKLNTSMVADIRKQAAAGVSLQDILKQYDFTSKDSIRAVISGDSWPGVK